MIEASVTLLGNLVDDPDVRCTANGNFVCSLRMASTSRRFDRSQNRWVDGHTVFVTVTCWRHLAENVGASLHKGDRTLVVGRLRQRSFETQDGGRRVVYEVDADAVAVDLTRQSAKVRRVVRSNREATEVMDVTEVTEAVEAMEADEAMEVTDAMGAVEVVDATEGEGSAVGSEPLAGNGMTGVHNGQTGVGTGSGYRDGGFTHAGADELLGESIPGDLPGAPGSERRPPGVPAQRPATV
ncbi:single-stranded DNA-binding protein [Frankia sp. Cas3]|uniref:single-stranded DNA-binding protein n=1 Tax=Frankia sp. Cas3 TaxID=3073926 RepID=UPI002AD36F35|nr:single-stranded DNA-binding protein [Frankia sp. Cas3]